MSTIQVGWDLQRHFYQSPSDPQIDKDLQEAEEAYRVFVEQYEDNDLHLREPSALKAALDGWDRLDSSKPIYYFHYLRELNSADPVVEARLQQLNEFYSKLGNQVVFFELRLGKISKARQRTFLADPQLSSYHYYLKGIFEKARYDLSEPVEKIVNRLSLPSSSLWIQGVSKELNQKTIRFEGKITSLPEASNLISQLPTQQRRWLHRKIIGAQRKLQSFAESEINALYIRKKIMDEERGYKEPYSATIIGNDNTEDEVMSLVEAVSRNFDIAHRFYAVKAKMMGESVLTYADRYARVGKLQVAIGFEESYQRLNSLFGSLKPEYGQILTMMHEQGQVDVYPRRNKSGGAFCSSSTECPTFVLLNWVDSVNAYLTHAHELGHAIHAQRSKTQKLNVYQGHSTSLAETASTFFEGIAFDALLQDMTEEDQILALHDRIQDDIATVFRQTACFNFELALHRQIREKGFVGHQEIAQLMNQHMGAYLGPVVKLTKADGYFWIGWSHIRRFFYVYTYAYGQLVSMALRQRVKENSSYISKVDEFLCAGASQTPAEILGTIGIVTNEQFFESGLAAIRSDLDRLESLTSK